MEEAEEEQSDKKQRYCNESDNPKNQTMKQGEKSERLRLAKKAL